MGFRYRLLKEGFRALISGGGRGVCVERGFSFLFVFLFQMGEWVWTKREKMFSFFILFLTHESVIRKKIKDIV